jgi:hypothetical protein
MLSNFKSHAFDQILASFANMNAPMSIKYLTEVSAVIAEKGYSATESFEKNDSISQLQVIIEVISLLTLMTGLMSDEDAIDLHSKGGASC